MLKVPVSPRLTARRAQLPSALSTGLVWLTLCGASLPLRAELEVVDAWIAEPPPVAVPAAGYVGFANTGDAQSVVIAIDSPDFARVELHRSDLVDGVASMTPVGSLKIPAGSEVRMAPGGLHLMLFDGARRLQAGDTVSLTFVTAQGQSLQVNAEVRKAGLDDGTPASAHSHHHVQPSMTKEHAEHTH